MLRVLGVLFVLLSLCDLLTTLMLMEQCGCNIEGNPVASNIYRDFGPIGMILLKAAMTTVAVGIVIYIRYKNRIFYPYLILGVGCLIYFGTVGYTLSLASFFNFAVYHP